MKDTSIQYSQAAVQSKRLYNLSDRYQFKAIGALCSKTEFDKRLGFERRVRFSEVLYLISKESYHEEDK